MSDRAAARITIGGPLPKELAEELYQLVIAQDATPEYPEDDWWSESLEGFRDYFAAGDNQLNGFDPAARGAMFGDLEDWCVDHGLTFVRYSDAGAEWEADVVWWQPGYDGVRATLADVSGNALISVERVRDTIIELRRDDALAVLDMYTPITVPPLVIV